MNIMRSSSILRRKQVESRTGLSCSTIYLRIKKGTFPKPIKLGERAVGWLESEIYDWLDEKMGQPELVWSAFMIFQIIRNIFQIEL